MMMYLSAQFAPKFIAATTTSPVCRSMLFVLSIYRFIVLPFYRFTVSRRVSPYANCNYRWQRPDWPRRDQFGVGARAYRREHRPRATGRGRGAAGRYPYSGGDYGLSRVRA